MSRPILLTDDFSLGSNQDAPRHTLPKGKHYLISDAIPELDGAPLAERGGWSRTYNASSLTSASYMAGVGFAPFTSGSRLVSIDEDGVLYYYTVGTATSTSTASGIVPAHPPVFYRQNLFILDGNGTSTAKYWGGTTTSSLTAAAPTAAVGTVWKDHLVVGYTSSNKERVWFSSGGDATSSTAWNTAADGQWVDCSAPVRGLATLRGMILVFEEGKTERLRGDVIPGVSGSDMVREPLFDRLGCSDPASIAVTDDYCIFANASGVFLTDGVGVADLTEQCGMSQYWLNEMSSYASTWTIAGAVHRGWYVFSVMDGSTFKHAGMIHVKKRCYIKLTNVKSPMMVSTPQGLLDTPPKLFMAERAAARVSDLTTMWTPGSSYKNDGDGTAVTAAIEFAHFLGDPGKKRWKNLYLKYLMTDAASDNPTFTVSYATDLESSSYTALGSTLSENSAVSRVRIPFGVGSEGVSLKITRVNASARFELYALESDAWRTEPGRL